MKNIIFIFVAVMAVMASGTGYGADNTQAPELETFDGKVAAVDLTDGIVTVKDAIEMKFTISGDTRFFKNVYDIEISDLKIGDYVVVEFYKDTTGAFRAASITVMYGEGA